LVSWITGSFEAKLGNGATWLRYQCERSLTLSTLAAKEISPTDEIDVGSNQKM
jgi:hypothetical protein